MQKAGREKEMEAILYNIASCLKQTENASKHPSLKPLALFPTALHPQLRAVRTFPTLTAKLK